MTRMTSPVIVITGASSGIGAELAQQAARRGATVVGVARREVELRAVISRCGPHHLALTADVTKRADVERVVSDTVARLGHIDVWVNNAGRGISRAPSALTDADLDEMLSVNVKSALYGMQSVLPHFKSRGRGHVINVSSVLGRIPFATGRAAYSASKHFLNSLTTNFRVEVHQTHPEIQVSLFSPGVVATDFGLNALHGGPDNRTLPQAQPVEEVAQAIMSLISSRAPEMYSRPGYQQQVVDYYAATDLTAVESRPPWVMPAR